MSKIEHHIGKLIPLSPCGDLEKTIKSHLNNIGVTDQHIQAHYESYVDYVEREMHYQAIIVDGIPYYIQDKELNAESIANSTKNKDGTIDYHLIWYNGRYSFSEVLAKATSKC